MITQEEPNWLTTLQCYKTSIEPTAKLSGIRLCLLMPKLTIYPQNGKLTKEKIRLIVNISDIHGERPRLGYSSYCISKATLDAVTKSLAIELAPEVRVNSVAPGAIIWADSEETEERTEALSFTPLKRTGEPSDIAKAVLYLAESTYVTGQILRVDGGRALNV